MNILNIYIMKKIKFTSLLLCGLLVFGGCGNMNNTTKGGLIGAGGGAAIGALAGALIGKGKGAAIGAAIGTAVGTGAGVIIGKKMDKAAAQAAAVEGAQVNQITDTNGLQAVKVTFDSGILFGFNSATLSANAKNSLSEFSQILKQNPTMDIAIYGHTDKAGTLAANEKVSLNRAQSVESYLKQQGVPYGQFKSVQGRAYHEYDESKSAAENRRVEIYMYASEQMIRDAEAGR